MICRLRWPFLIISALASCLATSSALAQTCNPECPSSPASQPLSPGLYVQVLQGMVNLKNQGGSQNFAAGQFGYVPALNQPPVILPVSPGLQFNPPPGFGNPIGHPAPTAPTASNDDCIVGSGGTGGATRCYAAEPPSALARRTDEAFSGLHVGMYTSAGQANSIDVYGMGGASITRGRNLGITDTAGTFPAGTTFSFRQTGGSGGIVASYGVPGFQGDQQLSFSGLFSYAGSNLTLTSIAGLADPASARTDTYGFAIAGLYRIGQTYAIGSGGFNFGTGNETLNVNGSNGSFNTKGYWADVQLGHVFWLLDLTTGGGSWPMPMKAPPQPLGGYALGLDLSGHIGYSDARVSGFTDSNGFIFGETTARYGDVGARAKLYAVVPNGRFLWMPYVAATIDQEFGFSSAGSIPVQAALPTGDSFSFQQALTFWGTELGVDARVPNGWMLGLKGFYQASADVNSAGGAAYLKIPIN